MSDQEDCDDCRRQRRADEQYHSPLVWDACERLLHLFASLATLLWSFGLLALVGSLLLFSFCGKINQGFARIHGQFLGHNDTSDQSVRACAYLAKANPGWNPPTSFAPKCT